MMTRQSTRHPFCVLASLSLFLPLLGPVNPAPGAETRKAPASQPVGAGQPAALPAIPVPDFGGLEPYRVIRVAAANSVVIRIGEQQIPVGFLGVEPYGARVKTGRRAESFSRQAAVFLRNLLGGESIYMVADEDEGAGASAVYVYRAPDGLFINAELIRQGYAYATTARPYQHRTAFVAYERNAARVRKGLWALPAGTRSATPAKGPARPGKRPAKDARKNRPGQAGPAPVSPRKQESARRRAKQAPELLGDKQSFIYHGPVCKLRNRIVFPHKIDSPRQAALEGYRPCRLCKPPR